MTLTELQTRVRTNTNRTSTSGDGATTDAQITALLNDAQRAMARDYDWRDLRIEKSTTTTVGTERYALPTDLKELLGMRVIDDAESVNLIELTRTALDEHDPYPASGAQAKPCYYAMDGNYYHLYPIPDAAYTLYLHYSRWPTDLSAAADVPSVDGADDYLIAYATAELFDSLQQFESGAAWKRKADELRVRIRAQDMSTPNYQPLRGVSGPPAEYWNNPLIGL